MVPQGDSSLKREAPEDSQPVGDAETQDSKRLKIFRNIMSRDTSCAARVISTVDDLDTFELEECYKIANSVVKAHSSGYQATPENMEAFFAVVFNGWTSSTVSPLPMEVDRMPLKSRGAIIANAAPLTFWIPSFPIGTFHRGGNAEYVSHVVKVRLRENGPSIQLRVAPTKKKEEDLPLELMAKITWMPKERINESMNRVLIQTLRRLDESFASYNESRAIEYARHFLYQRSQGHGSHPMASTYLFANLEHLINMFPILGAGRAAVLEPPMLFGPSKPTKHLNIPRGSITIG